jgi:hypothetical protein
MPPAAGTPIGFRRRSSKATASASWWRLRRASAVGAGEIFGPEYDKK